MGYELLTRARGNGAELRSVVVRQGGEIVFEHAAAPFPLDHVHPLYSVTKSFTSVAVGMMVEEGPIQLDRPWIEWFPEYEPAIADERFRRVTVRHLLTMTMGQDAEPYVTGDDDWALGVVAKPLAHEPGTVFLYNSLCTHLLSMLVQRVSGQTVEDLLARRLFAPLGISRWWWEQDRHGHSVGGFGLHLSTPDLAKFGQCLLDGGAWCGEQLIPAQWVREATSKQVETEPFYPAAATEDRNGYGFQYWMCAGGGYRCAGLFGQLCYVRPEDGLVVAASSSTTGSKALLDPLYQVLGGEESKPCFDRQVLDELPTIAGSPLSAWAARVAGRHALAPNAGGFDAFEVRFPDDSLMELALFRGDRVYRVEAGFDRWHRSADNGTQGIGEIFPFATHGAECDEAPAWDNRDVYACYAWTTPSTLELWVRELDYTRRTHVKLVLDGQHVVMTLGVESMYCGIRPSEYMVATC